MKQSNIVLPPARKCVVCQTLCDKPYGRNTYGDILCSKKCDKEWYDMSFEERFRLHNERRIA